MESYKSSKISLYLKFKLKSYKILIANKNKGRQSCWKALVIYKIVAEKSEDSIEDFEKELVIRKKLFKFK